MNNPQQTRLVIVHDVDADGIAAAWCINRLSDQYSSTLLIPQRAGVNEIPEGLTADDNVFLVDRTYPWDTLLLLSQQVFSVTVIDHHKSALLDYKTVSESGLYEFDNIILTEASINFEYQGITVVIHTSHSACMLAWLWSQENAIDPEPIEVPWFISYIEDRDLWVWKLNNSREINAGLHYHGHTFENYNTYYAYCMDEFVRSAQKFDIRDDGEIVLQTQLQIIKSIAHGPTVSYQEIYHTSTDKYGRLTGNGKLKFAIVCCPFTLISDLGNYMLYCTDEGFVQPDVVLCYNKTAEGYVYSIRSKYDMIWLAKEFGGGGHSLASGFKSQLPPESVLDMYR